MRDEDSAYLCALLTGVICPQDVASPTSFHDKWMVPLDAVTPERAAPNGLFPTFALEPLHSFLGQPFISRTIGSIRGACPVNRTPMLSPTPHGGGPTPDARISSVRLPVAPPRTRRLSHQRQPCRAVEEARTPNRAHLRHIDGQESGRSGGGFARVGRSVSRRGEERGARAGRATGRSVGKPRCPRIRPMTAAASMSAMRRRRPPHRGHARTSNAKARRIRSAHRWPRARRCASGVAVAHAVSTGSPVART